MYDGWHHDGWGPGAWIAMGLTMLAFWGLVVAVVVYVIRNVGHGPSGHAAAAGGDEALRILDERFARGEIDSDEYTRRRELLRSR
jgi:putative membrane protein